MALIQSLYKRDTAVRLEFTHCPFLHLSHNAILIVFQGQKQTVPQTNQTDKMNFLFHQHRQKKYPISILSLKFNYLLVNVIL